jgi:hypothetical protein
MFSRYSEATDNMFPIPIPTYKASNESPLPPQSTSEASDTLHLSGYIINKIAHLSEPYAPPTYDWLSQKFDSYTSMCP